VYLSSPEYDFFDDIMYYEKAATILTVDRLSGLTVSQMEAVSASICRTFMGLDTGILQHPVFQRLKYPRHHSIALPGDAWKIIMEAYTQEMSTMFTEQAG
jgi:hypothetical protein